MRQIGIDAPPVPGAAASAPAALVDLFEKARLKGLNTTSIEVAVSFRDFDDFWRSQTQHNMPTTKVIAAMTPSDRLALMEAVRTYLRPLRGGVGYSARANAVRGHCSDGLGWEAPEHRLLLAQSGREPRHSRMSAFGGEADVGPMARDVRF